MNRSFFFSSNFLLEFNWKKKLNLRVGTIKPDHKNQIAAGLKDLSPESTRLRFLGSKKAFTDKELNYLTQLDGNNHYALGIEEIENQKRGIAIIRMVRSSSIFTEAEVAITIIDEYQKFGLGTFLMKLLVLAASEREIKKLSFTSSPLNEGIHKLITKIGIPQEGNSSHDSVQFYLNIDELDLTKIKDELAKILPTIESFRIKT
jgi:RimJ/RimL family protein N-acetyltransferase